MTTVEVQISGASDDLIEFDGAIYGEATLGSGDVSKITLKAPDGTKMSLAAEFCGHRFPDGWVVRVVDNPGGWEWDTFVSREDEGPDCGITVNVPEGTTAKCDGKRVR